MTKIFGHIFVSLCLLYLGLSFSFNSFPSIGGFPVSRGTGVFFIALSISYLAFVIIYRRRIIEAKIAEKEIKIEANRTMICPSCREPAFATEFPDNKCPKCDSEVENLYGFYDRHPELRDDVSPKSQ